MPKYDWPLKWPEPEKVPSWSLGLLLSFWALVLIVPSLWVIIEFLKALASGNSEAIRNVGLIFLAVVSAPFVVWRAWIADRQRKAAEDQAQTSKLQADRALDRDYADLFAKAIEQLGATREAKLKNENIIEPNMEVRLGAIHILERISRDSEKDHLAVMETLCAYIRENAPASALPTHPRESFGLEYEENENAYQIWLEHDEWGICNGMEPRRDIQAILRVIGSRPFMGRDERTENVRAVLDLRRTNLVGANLAYGNFHRIDFSGSRMENIDAWDSHFQGSNFNWTVLTYADFSYACFELNNFSNSELTKIDFSGSNLFRVNFYEANLSGVSFGGGWFQSCSFIDANLKRASFEHGHFRDCNFSGANLTAATYLTTEFLEANSGLEDATN